MEMTTGEHGPMVGLGLGVGRGVGVAGTVGVAAAPLEEPAADVDGWPAPGVTVGDEALQPASATATAIKLGASHWVRPERRMPGIFASSAVVGHSLAHRAKASSRFGSDEVIQPAVRGDDVELSAGARAPAGGAHAVRQQRFGNLHGRAGRDDLPDGAAAVVAEEVAAVERRGRGASVDEAADDRAKRITAPRDTEAVARVSSNR
jgi:hypothetical protein